MSTDRELLELAAQAAGVDVIFSHLGMAFHAAPGVDYSRRWNPIGDDGDALRLAVKLASLNKGAFFEITISAMYDGRGHASAGFYSRDNPSESEFRADLGEATRRAIVRAAASLAKTASHT
jgi:hypothetical protein